MNVNRQARSAGGVDGDSRRPIGYWAEFNNWWRTKLSEDGCRPSQAELAQWFEVNAPLCWRPDEMPSLQEVRTHAKCLRSTEQVRNYFRKYRAARKASSASVRVSGSDSDSDGPTPTESVSVSASALKSSRVLTAGTGAGQLLDPGITSHSTRAVSASAAITTGAETRNLLPFVFGSNGGAGIFLAGAGGALAGLAALQAAAAAAGSSSAAAAMAAAAGALPSNGGSCVGGAIGVVSTSPRNFKPSTSACSGQMPLSSQHKLAQTNNGSRYALGGSGAVGAVHQAVPTTATAAATAAANRQAVTLPPVAAAVSGPVISFSSGGQPQHSAHGPGQSRSIGGGIVLRLPALQRTGSTGGPAAKPRGSTPTKHSSPAPPAPAAKRQAIAQPACSTGQTSSVHLGEYGGAYPAAYTCAPSVSGASSLGPGRQVAACFPPTVTSGIRDNRGSMAANGASAAATDVAGLPAQGNFSASMSGAPHGYIPTPSSCPSVVHHHHQQTGVLHTVDSSAPVATAYAAAAASGAAVAPGMAVTAAATAPDAATIAMASPESGPTADEMACDAGALSPTQAFFRAWQQNDVDDLLVDLPGDADLVDVPSRQEGNGPPAAAAAAALDSLALQPPTACAEAGGGHIGTDAIPGAAPATAAAATALNVTFQVKREDACDGEGATRFFKEGVLMYSHAGSTDPAQLSVHIPQSGAISAHLQQSTAAHYYSSYVMAMAQTQTTTTSAAPQSADHRQLPSPALHPHPHQQQQVKEEQQKQSLVGLAQSSPGIDAALRWWPDPNGGVGSGLPPIRTTLQTDATSSKSQRTGDLQHQQMPTPTSAQHGGGAQAATVAVAGMNGGGEGFAPASGHELFSILDLPQLQIPPICNKAGGRQQQQRQPQTSGQPAMSQQQSQHDQQVAGETPDPSSHSEGTAQRGSVYPPMPYPQAWPAPPYLGAPEAAMGASQPGMSLVQSAAAAGPYQPSMCMPYPYGNGTNYPPYGYCPPPPYGLPPHHPYYYHQMPPPPPAGSGYEMYGWPPYHLPPHPSMPYPGAPYHGYPVAMGPMMPPPPQQMAHGGTADCPSSGAGVMASSHMEASSVRVRGTRQGPAASSGGGGGVPSFLQSAPATAEPLMPGRYVWQATGGGGLSKLRRAMSGQQAVTEGGECNTNAGSGRGGLGAGTAAAANDAVSTMHSRVLPATSAARTRTAAQGSYCSNFNQCYSQSMGAAHTQAVTVTATGADVTGGGEAEDCVESRNATAGVVNPGGREGGLTSAATAPAAAAAVVVAQQLMPPPPPRQPRPERITATSAPSAQAVESHLSGGRTLAPALPPGLLSLPLPLTEPKMPTIAAMPLQQLSVPAATYTHAARLLPQSGALEGSQGADACTNPAVVGLPLLGVVPPPPSSVQVEAEQLSVALQPSSESDECGVVRDAVLPPQLAIQELSPLQQQQAECDVAATTANAGQRTATVAADGLDGGDGIARQYAIDTAGVYVCDDWDLLDISSITAGLLSSPGSHAKQRAPGTSRATASRATAPSTATTSAAAAAATFASVSAGGPPSLDATPNTAAAAAAAANFAFTPVSACTASRCHAFAAPPRPFAPTINAAVTAGGGCGTQPSDPPSHQKCPISARSTDVFRALVTPRTLCGSPLDCSLLASWLTSPASMTSLDACTRPLGLLLGSLDEDGDVSTRSAKQEREDDASHGTSQHPEGEAHGKASEPARKPGTVVAGAGTGEVVGVCTAVEDKVMEVDMEKNVGSGAGGSDDGCGVSQLATPAPSGSLTETDEIGNILCNRAPVHGGISTAREGSTAAEGASTMSAAAAAPQVPDVTAHIRITYVPPSSTSTPAHADSAPCIVALKEDPGFVSVALASFGAVPKSLSEGGCINWQGTENQAGNPGQESVCELTSSHQGGSTLHQPAEAATGACSDVFGAV